MNDELAKKIRQQITDGNLEGFRSLITTVGDIPEELDALHIAANQKQDNIIRYLVEEIGMDVNTHAGYNDATPLYKMGYSSYPAETMNLLISFGADVNAVTNSGEPVIFEFIRGNNTEGLEVLAENGADFSIRDHKGKTALMTAVWMSNLTIAKWLLERGADPAETDNDGLNVTQFRESAALDYAIEYSRQRGVDLGDSKKLIPLVQLKRWIEKTGKTKKPEVNLGGNFEEVPQEIVHYPEIKAFSITNNPVLKSLGTALFNLPNLEELLISSVPQLKEIPKEIAQLKKLKKLSIRHSDRILFIPDEICELAELEYLELSLPHIKYLPADIGRLTKLKELHVHQGAMQFTPASIKELKNLTHLTLANQDLDLSEMDIIFHFPLLKELDLQNNAFDTIPRKILELENLKKFAFKGNPIVNPPIKEIKGGFKGLKQYFSANI